MFGQPTSPRIRAALAGGLSAGLVFGVAACGGSSGDSSASTGASASSIDCAPYTKFGDLKGKTVAVYTGIVTPEDAPQKDSYKPFEKCTGVTIKYEGDKSFETQILVRAKAGQPARHRLSCRSPACSSSWSRPARRSRRRPTSTANVDKFFTKDWKGYGTVDGKFYAAPLGANVKSLVWYSPKEFKDSGYAVPTTLDELKTLSDKMVADRQEAVVRRHRQR